MKVMKIEVSTISHEEAMIRHFMEDPEFAEFYLKEVMADGSLNEIRRTQQRVEEAKARREKHAIEA